MLTGSEVVQNRDLQHEKAKGFEPAIAPSLSMVTVINVTEEPTK
jgi:hypothetical protein